MPARGGRYQADAEVTLAAGRRAATPVRFEVLGRERELRSISLQGDLLRRIAEATGGRYHTVIEARAVRDELRELVRAKGGTVVIELGSSPWLFVALIGLLGLEWWERKRKLVM